MLCAWVAVIGVPAAHAYNLCMSTPLASFDGFGWASPDGRFLAVGGRVVTVADLREVARTPDGNGNFSADSRRLLLLKGMERGATRSSLDIVDIATPGTPPHHIDFTTGGFVRLSPNGGILSITPNETDRPDPDALGGQREYYTTQLLRTADGASLARIDRAYEAKDWALDAKEQHAILFLSNLRPESGEVELIDLQTGQIRRLNTNLTSGDVGMSPDGTVAVTTDFNTGRTIFWDWASGNQLGSVSNSGFLAFTPDSNWLFTEDIAVRRGDWSKPYRLPNLSQLDVPLAAFGNRMVAVLKGGTLVVLDGRDGHLLCRREIAQPAQYHVLAVTAQRVVLLETDTPGHYAVRIYAIENEDAARARVQREAAQAKTASGKLAPAKRAEAQGIFKQAFELFQAGEFATAARLFESGLAIDPGNGPANYYLGETYARLGNKDRAALYYTRAAAIAPTTKEGALASTRLSN